MIRRARGTTVKPDIENTRKAYGQSPFESHFSEPFHGFPIVTSRPPPHNIDFSKFTFSDITIVESSVPYTVSAIACRPGPLSIAEKFVTSSLAFLLEIFFFTKGNCQRKS